MRQRQANILKVFSLLLAIMVTGTGTAGAFTSGSTGALGAFAPVSNTTVALPPDGILNYTTVNIPSGVTVTFTRNAANTSVTLLATGDITIAGTIDVRGAAGPPTGPTAALGGPGGFPAGVGTPVGGTIPVGGAGPGGGAPADASGAGSNATYGAPTSFVSLTPLFGGSGGGGGRTAPAGTAAGGGGGGGAIVIASSTQITLSGSPVITANGGNGATSPGGTNFYAGGGSGGAIRLVANQISGPIGQLSAVGGTGTNTSVAAGSGRIRLEATTLSTTGSSTPSASTSTTPGPVTPASTPPLINLPSLTITAVNSLAAPVSPVGSYTAADIVLPQDATNPVSVTITVSNVPLPTPVTIQVIPQLSGPTTVSGTLTGTSTTIPVSLPRGEVSQVLAFASLVVPTQTAALWPLIDEEPVERIVVAAKYGDASSVTFVTRSGKMKREHTFVLVLPENKDTLETTSREEQRTQR